MMGSRIAVICIETRHVKAFLKARPDKTDRSDARGIAQIMRVNRYRPVHVKTLTSQKRRALLTARKLLQEKAIAIENDICGLLRNFGLKVGAVGTAKFEEAHLRPHRRHARSRGDHGAAACRPTEAARRICTPAQTSAVVRRGDAICKHGLDRSRFSTVPSLSGSRSLGFQNSRYCLGNRRVCVVKVAFPTQRQLNNL